MKKKKKVLENINASLLMASKPLDILGKGLIKLKVCNRMDIASLLNPDGG
jgi:hypothetical protein